MTDYRQRIYQYYVHARQESLAPKSVEEFKVRESRLNPLIYNYFPANHEAKIVDLGCGHGALIYFARKLGYFNIIGVDRSPEQVAEAKRLGIENVQEGDLMDTLNCLEKESLDVVISYDVIEHFFKEELVSFVDEVLRVLKTGGRWIIHAPNGESIFCGRILFGDFTHELAFTRTSITQLLKASGFQQVECFEDVLPVSGFKSAVRWVLWKLIRGILRFYLAVETGRGAKECIFSQNFTTVAIK
ncbi:MAG: class I SAM-dependent methyltransferase [Crinalium sp.]